MDEIVVFDQAVKDYGSKTIGPLSFTVGKGEVVGLLGPNGSGKSTSIRMLLGLSRPTSGRVALLGLDPIRDHARALGHVGYSPELPNLQTFMTPRTLLKLVGQELGMKGSQLDSGIEEQLESVGLAEYGEYKIGKLSKGMVQRLSVAQAFLGSPSLLILDEPMIGIDPAGVVHFRTLFREFAAKGGTLIMSSHVMSEVESLCTSVTVIHSGRLMFRGTMREFIEDSMSSRLIYLELDSYPEDLVILVKGLPGVLSVTLASSGLIIEVQKGGDMRPRISELVVKKGIGLRSVGYSRTEIDEAYMNAIRGAKS